MSKTKYQVVCVYQYSEPSLYAFNNAIDTVGFLRKSESCQMTVFSHKDNHGYLSLDKVTVESVFEEAHRELTAKMNIISPPKEIENAISDNIAELTNNDAR